MTNSTASKTAPAKHQSPLVAEVFDDFIERIRKDSSIGGSIAQRLADLLASSPRVSPEELEAILFFEEPLP